MHSQLIEVKEFAKQKRGNMALLSRKSGVSKGTVSLLVSADIDVRTSTLAKLHAALLRIKATEVRDDRQK